MRAGRQAVPPGMIDLAVSATESVRKLLITKVWMWTYRAKICHLKDLHVNVEKTKNLAHGRINYMVNI